MQFTLADLVRRFGGELRGDESIVITNVATLEHAGATELAYVVDAQYHAHLAQTRAGAVILDRQAASQYTGNAWIAENPRLLFARVAALLHPEQHTAGIDQRAVVDPQAQVAKTAYVGPHAVIEAGAVIADNVVIGAGSYIGARVRINKETHLAQHVTVYRDCEIGQRCVVHAGAVIGSDGFGFAQDGSHWVKIPQLGRAIVGDDVEIGANTTIDRGALGDTVIGNGVKLDNLIQIAHNVHVGEDTAMAACVGVAGSAIIGKRCTIGGGAGILGHLEIGDDVHITATSLVSHSIIEPGAYSSTVPVQPINEWRKNIARFRHLDELARRFKTFENKIQQFFQGNNR